MDLECPSLAGLSAYLPALLGRFCKVVRAVHPIEAPVKRHQRRFMHACRGINDGVRCRQAMAAREFGGIERDRFGQGQDSGKPGAGDHGLRLIFSQLAQTLFIQFKLHQRRKKQVVAVTQHTGKTLAQACAGDPFDPHAGVCKRHRSGAPWLLACTGEIGKAAVAFPAIAIVAGIGSRAQAEQFLYFGLRYQLQAAPGTQERELLAGLEAHFVADLLGNRDLELGRQRCGTHIAHL